MLASVLALTIAAGPMQPAAPVDLSSLTLPGGTPLLRELRFTDGADSSVQVFDGRSGALVEAVHGEQGFLRGVLRGLAQERLRRGIGSGPVFVLQASHDGRLTLSDPSTGRRVDLESFGRDNASVFARWLQPAAPATR
jgi:putative photosynthetic complex assembly protein